MARRPLSIADPDIVVAAETYARGVPFGCLARLRARTPVVWAGGRAGCWVVLRHHDALHVLDHPELYGEPDPPDPPEPAPAGFHIPVEAMLDRVQARGAADFAGDVAQDLPEMLRDALAGALYALLRHPAQYTRLRLAAGDGELLHGELVQRAVEEILRWWSPVLHLKRSVLRETVLGGVPVRPGELVAVWLASADRDGEVFPAADRFEITRTPNPHLAFGHGARPCAGAGPARDHLRDLVTALALRPGVLELAGEPIRVRSNARNGFERLPVRFAS